MIYRAFEVSRYPTIGFRFSVSHRKTGITAPRAVEERQPCGARPKFRATLVACDPAIQIHKVRACTRAATLPAPGDIVGKNTIPAPGRTSAGIGVLYI